MAHLIKLGLIRTSTGHKPNFCFILGPNYECQWFQTALGKINCHEWENYICQTIHCQISARDFIQEEGKTLFNHIKWKAKKTLLNNSSGPV